jgi:hypothetical protein
MKSIIQEYLLFESPESVTARYKQLLQKVDLLKDKTDQASKNEADATRKITNKMKEKYPYLAKVTLSKDHYKGKTAQTGQPTGKKKPTFKMRWKATWDEIYRQWWAEQRRQNIFYEENFQKAREGYRKKMKSVRIGAITIGVSTLLALTLSVAKKIGDARAMMPICNKLSTSDKNKCKAKISLKAKQAQIKFLKSKKPKCKQSNNPAKCMKAIDITIAKISGKL